MATHFRTSKLERIIKRLEAKKPLYENAAFGSVGYGKLEMLNEIINELRHEFRLKEE